MRAMTTYTNYFTLPLVKHCGAKYKDGMLELADHIPEEEELFPDGWREKLHAEYKKK